MHRYDQSSGNEEQHVRNQFARKCMPKNHLRPCKVAWFVEEERGDHKGQEHRYPAQARDGDSMYSSLLGLIQPTNFMAQLDHDECKEIGQEKCRSAAEQ